MTYTPELVKRIIDEYRADPSPEALECLAQDTGKSVKSLIAKLSQLGVYKPQKAERLNKLGEPVIKKAEMVPQIEAALGISAPSLVKVSKYELKALMEAVLKLSVDSPAVSSYNEASRAETDIVR